MNQLTVQKTPEPPYLSEQRKDQRHEIINLLAVTEKGTGQILDINGGGLSFGCLYPHDFPQEFHMDILDAKGSHIKKIKVRKMRETTNYFQNPLSTFELVIGVEFFALTSVQADELAYLLENNIEMIIYPHLHLI
jgi:hypothetical protein